MMNHTDQKLKANLTSDQRISIMLITNLLDNI
jgi:hypothetical protein